MRVDRDAAMDVAPECCERGPRFGVWVHLRVRTYIRRLEESIREPAGGYGERADAQEEPRGRGRGEDVVTQRSCAYVRPARFDCRQCWSIQERR